MAPLPVHILDTANPDHRHLVCSVSATPETLVSGVNTDTDPDSATDLDDTEPTNSPWSSPSASRPCPAPSS
jgi:hypothetical protein